MVQIVIGAVLISFSSVFVKLVNVGPTTALFYRFLFGAVTLVLFSVFTKTALYKDMRSLLFAALAGFFFSLDLFLWHRSIHWVGPGLATILANFQVFILTLTGVVFMKERLRPVYVLSVLLAFSGLILLTGVGTVTMDSLYKKGIIYGLLTALCYSAITLTIQKSQKLPVKLDPMANMAWLCVFGALFGSVEAAACGESFTIPDMQSLLFLLLYGAVCSGMGWYMITKGLPGVTISMAGLVLVLQPAFAFIWDILFFAKPVNFLNITGAAVTIIAIYMGAVFRTSR